MAGIASRTSLRQNPPLLGAMSVKSFWINHGSRRMMCWQGVWPWVQPTVSGSALQSRREFLASLTGWSSSGKMISPIYIVLLSLLLEDCTRPSVHEPVTLTLLAGWGEPNVQRGAPAGVAAIHLGKHRNPSQSPSVQLAARSQLSHYPTYRNRGA
jgi:hypothetical protein